MKASEPVSSTPTQAQSQTAKSFFGSPTEAEGSFFGSSANDAVHTQSSFFSPSSNHQANTIQPQCDTCDGEEKLQGPEDQLPQLSPRAEQSGMIQRQQSLDDPARFQTVNQNLFAGTPSGREAQTWEADTEALIIRQFKASVQTQIDQRPTTILGGVTQRTTEADAETDALAANDRIVARFPEISSRLSETQVRTAVEMIPVDQALDRAFMAQWLENQLIGRTSISDYTVDNNNPAFQGVINSILSDTGAFDLNAAFATLRQQQEDAGVETSEIDAIIAGERRRIGSPTWVSILQILANRQGAFAQQGQRIALNQGITPEQRRLTLLHEFVHFYAHDLYKTWVESTTSPRYYNEGFTEFLCREVMTSDERSQRAGRGNNYQDRLEAIETQVHSFATTEDIAAAFFKGEVWRLEHQSEAAGQAFGQQIGIQPGATHSEEVSQSISSPGINQTVRAGYHYRFMNIGIGLSDPKPEHLAFFQSIFSDVIQPNANLRIRFVGHTDSTGSLSFNRALSHRRVDAFYQLARDAGVPPAQLLNASAPEFEGEVSGTSENDNSIGKAMNRRVELFIIPPGSTRLEDNVFRLGRLRGEGVDPNDISMGHSMVSVLRNSPDAEQSLPFNTGGWDANVIMTRLGQHDLMGGTDNDNDRCVQAVALASYIPEGPSAVQRYLDLITRQGMQTRSMNNRRRTALEVIRFVQGKITTRTATFGDLSWVQEAVHDLFFDDVSGTPFPDILRQITPSSDIARRVQSLNIWTSSPAELMAEVRRLQPGEQLVTTNSNVVFNESFDQLEELGVAVTSPMQVNNQGRLVTIRRIDASQRPNPQDIDPNRDKVRGHQVLIFVDNSRRTWLYEPEITESGQHLFDLNSNPDALIPYFRELPDIESYEYVQVMGRISSNVTPAGGTP
jgi:hypothetical protein